MTAAREVIEAATAISQRRPDAAVRILMASRVPAELHAINAIGMFSALLQPDHPDGPDRLARLRDEMLDMAADTWSARQPFAGYAAHARDVRMEAIALARAYTEADADPLNAIVGRSRYGAHWHAWAALWLVGVMVGGCGSGWLDRLHDLLPPTTESNRGAVDAS